MSIVNLSELRFLIALLAIVVRRPWDPTNLSECRERAARTARSNDAMRVLLDVCNSQFRDARQFAGRRLGARGIAALQ
jgi:hypothetical protein